VGIELTLHQELQLPISHLLGIDDNADATAITIDSSERVGIGTASPDCKLKVDAGTTASIFAPAMIITSSTGGLVEQHL
jgi:hypothetical protein